MHIRVPANADWPRLLELANQSLAHVPGAETQKVWWNNRQAYDETVGTRRHFVALNEDEEIIGYTGIESGQQEGVFRLYVVTLPDLLPTVGEDLYELSFKNLRELGAQQVWFTEMADDDRLLGFIRRHGFQDRRRLTGLQGPDLMCTCKEAPL